jgi:hypothetical protein
LRESGWAFDPRGQAPSRAALSAQAARGGLMASRRGAMRRRWGWFSTRGPGMGWPVTVRQQHARCRGFSWSTASARGKLELSPSRPAKGTGRNQRPAPRRRAHYGLRARARGRQPRSIIGVDRSPPSRPELATPNARRPMRDLRVAFAAQAPPRACRKATLVRLPDVRTRHNRDSQPSTMSFLRPQSGIGKPGSGAVQCRTENACRDP